MILKYVIYQVLFLHEGDLILAQKSQVEAQFSAWTFTHWPPVAT